MKVYPANPAILDCATSHGRNTAVYRHLGEKIVSIHSKQSDLYKGVTLSATVRGQPRAGYVVTSSCYPVVYGVNYAQLVIYPKVAQPSHP